MKRKFVEEQGEKEEMNASSHKLLSSPISASASTSASTSTSHHHRSSRVQRRSMLLSPTQQPVHALRQLSERVRSVSPDHSHSYHYSLLNHHQPSASQQPQLHLIHHLKSQKVVRFANPLVEIKEISRSCHADHRPSHANNNNNNNATSTTSVHKSVLFYSRHDYMKFYVRERSRLAFQDLTKRICQEQERRLRSRRRIIPPYFCVLNFFNAIMTINDLGNQVQQHAKISKQFQQQQQIALLRQKKRRRRHLVQTLQGTRTPPRRNNNNNSIPNHMTPPGMVLNYQVTPRPPRRNTVCAPVA